MCTPHYGNGVRNGTIMIKFIYSEKATKCCEIFTLLLTGTAWDKSKVKILQNFVAFSEYMNFDVLKSHLHIIKNFFWELQVALFFH